MRKSRLPVLGIWKLHNELWTHWSLVSWISAHYVILILRPAKPHRIRLCITYLKRQSRRAKGTGAPNKVGDQSWASRSKAPVNSILRFQTSSVTLGECSGHRGSRSASEESFVMQRRLRIHGGLVHRGLMVLHACGWGIPETCSEDTIECLAWRTKLECRQDVTGNSTMILPSI